MRQMPRCVQKEYDCVNILTIIFAILIFSVIIFVHEFGHFITARMCGVTVHEFAIGMGPVLWKKQGKKTLYALRAIPVGGFCRLEGEDGDSDDPGSFSKRPPIQRIIILAAGAFMNLLLGFIVVLSLVLSSAAANGGIGTTVVDSVMPEASAQFLQPGDEIIAVGGNRVHIRRDLNFELQQNGAAETTLTYRRGDTTHTDAFTPMETTYEDGSKGYLVGFHVQTEKPTVFSVLHESFFQTVWMGKLVVLSVRMLLTGQVGIRDMSGPVGVVSAMSTAAQSGWMDFLFLAAFLAVNIGLMNLLPLPALDGGRILFVLVELIFRKPVPPEKEGLIHFIGFALLMVLIVYVSFQDIWKLFA